MAGCSGPLEMVLSDGLPNRTDTAINGEHRDVLAVKLLATFYSRLSEMRRNLDS